MIVTKTHFAYRVDRWDADGNNVLEHIAGAEDLTVAVAACDAAVRRWAGEVIIFDRAPASSRTAARFRSA
jgi:hypothetical protein